MMISFRMIAVRASFGGLPFSMRVLYLRFISGLNRGGDKGGHIDGVLDECPTATNVAFPFERAAVLGDRGDAHQTGDLFVVESTEFGHFRQQGHGGDRAR